MTEPETERSTQLATTRPLDPLMLLQTLIEKGADAEQLGKMTDLVERWQASAAKMAFAKAMNFCQSEMPVIVRDDYNSHTKSPYVRLETLQNVIRPIYTRHGFSISWSQGERAAEGLSRVVGTLFHIDGHSERYQGDYPIDGAGAKGGQVMNPLQGTVSSHTYAQKDMLRLMFNLTIMDKDADGNQADSICAPDQVGVINDLIRDCEANGNPVDLPRFWKVFNVEGLHALPQSRFAQAVKLLGDKRRQVKK